MADILSRSAVILIYLVVVGFGIFVLWRNKLSLPRRIAIIYGVAIAVLWIGFYIAILAGSPRGITAPLSRGIHSVTAALLIAQTWLIRQAPKGA